MKEENVYRIFSTNMIELEPAIISDYPLHWFPLLVGIIKSQWQFHQTNLNPGFSSSLFGVEEMCYSNSKRDERGRETHLITLSLCSTWYHWMITENYSVTKISWLKPEFCCWSKIKPCNVILIPDSFPVVCCLIETNWKKIYIYRDHSERKYCQSWEQYLLTDKKEVERKKNISEEDEMVL